jgi:hypothetical protein
MGEKAKPASGETDMADFLVSWKHPDGTISSVGPLPHDRAQNIVEVYGRMYPEQTFWVQPLPREIREARQGRVRRARRLPNSESGH